MEAVANDLHEVPADKLAEIYIKIRDKRVELKEKFEAEDAVLKEQQDLLAQLFVMCVFLLQLQQQMFLVHLFGTL